MKSHRLRRSFGASLALGLLVSAPALSQAQSLTTTFASNNGFSGSMFNLNIFNTLTIDRLDINVDGPIGLTENYALYVKSGSYVGSENIRANWTYFGTFSATGAGKDNPTPMSLGSGLTLTAGSSYGIYLTEAATTSSILRYTNGNGTDVPGSGTNQTYTNADLQLLAGAGKGPLSGTAGSGTETFSGTIFTPRVWNGTIYYSTAVVPGPAALPLFAGGLSTGLAFVRKRRRQ